MRDLAHQYLVGRDCWTADGRYVSFPFSQVAEDRASRNHPGSGARQPFDHGPGTRLILAALHRVSKYSHTLSIRPSYAGLVCVSELFSPWHGKY